MEPLPSQPQRRGRRRWISFATVFVILAFGVSLAACASRTSIDQSPPASTTTPSAQGGSAGQQPAPAATPTVAPSSAPIGDPATAIKAVIAKANAEQASALERHDPTVMRDTATPAYYQLMVQTEQEMEKGGVSAIKLLSIQWGQITSQGSTARAITTETWQITAADGTTQQSTDRNLYGLVEQGNGWLIASDSQIGGGSGGGTGSGSGGSTGNGSGGSTAVPGSLDQSSNWSGYAATGGPFTSVSGTWRVPQVKTDSAAGSADASWVGIGGVTSNDLIQAGTEATVTGSGRVQYSAWIEMLPKASQTVPLTVSPGDSVTVSITQQQTGTWLITMNDTTSGQSYRTTVQYSSSLSSAEWIEEAPSTASAARARVVTLDDFGQVGFSKATAQSGTQQVTVAQAGGKPIAMGGRTGTIATTSALGSDGASFVVTRVETGL